MTTYIITSPNHPIEKIKEILTGTKSVRLISPYIKESFIRRIIDPISKITDVRLIARLTNYELSTKSVDLSALDLIAQYGDVRCLNTLHAKGILTERQAYIGSFNFTHSAFFRNYEMGVITSESVVLTDFAAYFDQTWEKALPFADIRQNLVVDEVILQTVGWQKVREWWDIVTTIDLREYNTQAEYIIFLPMPKPPLDRANMIIKPILLHYGMNPSVEIVLFSELYGAIPYRFADQFGFNGEFYFDEPAEKFYVGRSLSDDAQPAAKSLSAFMQTNEHLKMIAPLPDNYKRLALLETAATLTNQKLFLPEVQSPFIGYMRSPQNALAFLKLNIDS